METRAVQTLVRMGGRKSQPGPGDINSTCSDIKAERAYVE